MVQLLKPTLAILTEPTFFDRETIGREPKG